MSSSVDAALHALRQSERVLVCAGAGLGVDGGLPDFRGSDGWWRQAFAEVARPSAFVDHPRRAWGFFALRQRLYAETPPHTGYAILASWVGRDGFVFTSNVDGHFRAAGVEEARICEAHGRIDRWQCTTPCSRRTWPAGAPPEVDAHREASGPLPVCPHCGALARPNVCMFDDNRYIGVPTVLQARRYTTWLDAGPPPVVLELGAGRTLPAVRRESEAQMRTGSVLIRVDPHDCAGPPGTIEVAERALPFLQALGPV